MFGGIDPKKMQAMMKQMGIKQEEIEATRVTIEAVDKKIVIENPNVQKIVMQGQESWQITGEAHVQGLESFSDADVQLVMERTGKGEEAVRAALEETGGDIAEAIVNLS